MISSQLLREARLRADLTQAELGRRVGKAGSAIGRWERGEALPSLESLRRVINAAGLELAISITRADDHDLALIRRCLSRTPAQRLSDLVHEVNTLAAMARTARG